MVCVAQGRAQHTLSVVNLGVGRRRVVLPCVVAHVNKPGPWNQDLPAGMGLRQCGIYFLFIYFLFYFFSRYCHCSFVVLYREVGRTALFLFFPFGWTRLPAPSGNSIISYARLSEAETYPTTWPRRFFACNLWLYMKIISLPRQK